MSKEEIILKLISVFRYYGYEGATISRLSEATGLKKASLYYHFQGGKEEMAEAVLDYVKNWLDKNIFAPLESDQSPNDRIKEMSQTLDQFYQSGKAPCFLSVMSVGEADNIFHQQLENSLKRWIEAIAKVVEETGVKPQEATQKAENAMMLIQGSLVLVRITKNIKPFKRAISMLPKILLENNL